MDIHKYFMFVEGLKIPSRLFDTRLEAEICMHLICQHKHITVDCVEYDKHERKYSNHNGIRFYINRV